MNDQLHASVAVPSLRGLTYPILVEVWANSMTIRDRNTVRHSYKNQDVGTFMEAISFVVTTCFEHMCSKHVEA